MVSVISRSFPRKASQLRWLIFLNAVILTVGLFSPMLTLEKFIIIENTFSVISGVFQLFREGKWFLFLLLAVFSILIPVLKIILLYQLVALHSVKVHLYRRYLELMHQYGRWSMLDVFVVAVLIVAVKLDLVLEVQVHFGLYAFSAAVLLTMFITGQVVELSNECLKEEGTST
jgi:paraquat-inducible protein A